MTKVQPVAESLRGHRLWVLDKDGVVRVITNEEDQ